MSIVHHPSDQTLGAFASGTLDAGRHVVVSAHIEMCPSCQRMVAALDRLGGAHLAQLPGTPLAPGALHKALSRLGEQPSATPVAPRPQIDLPVRLAALAPYALGRWRWIGWGVHTRTASVPEPGGTRVFLLKAAPGTRLPHHTHTGTELTLILQGAFTHAGGRFGIGDLDDADDTVVHQPIVEPGEDCICLVAMRGQLRLPGWLGQLLQPFVRL
jgi:putative transcriptional regulator